MPPGFILSVKIAGYDMIRGLCIRKYSPWSKKVSLFNVFLISLTYFFNVNSCTHTCMGP